MQKKKSITAKDIASACNISQATVSYVINNKAGKKISEPTRTRILETARELGYIPSASARSMKTRRAMSIGIVSGTNNINIGFNHVLKGIKNCTDAASYSLTLLNSEDADPVDTDYLNYYYSGRIDGILFLFYDMQDSTKEQLKELNIPYLCINENGISGNEIEDAKALEKAIIASAAFCKKRNFHNIHFFSLQRGDRLYSYKYDIFIAALQELYPEAVCKRIIIQAKDLTNTELMEKLSEYLDADEISLAVTPNQRLGWLMQSCILKKNFILPQTVKHICLASSHIFHLVYPTVTSIDVPLTEIGEFAAKQLIGILNGAEFEQCEFSCSLKEGLSTK